MLLQPFADLQEFLSFAFLSLSLLDVFLVLAFFVLVVLFLVVAAGFSLAIAIGALVAASIPVIAAATRRDFTEFFIFFFLFLSDWQFLA